MRIFNAVWYLVMFVLLYLLGYWRGRAFQARLDNELLLCWKALVRKKYPDALEE